MDLGITDKVRPLIERVRQMVEDEIAPLLDRLVAEKTDAKPAIGPFAQQSLIDALRDEIFRGRT